MRSRSILEDGQGLVEYVALLLFVALVSVAILSVYGAQLAGLIDKVTLAMAMVTEPGHLLTLESQRTGKAGNDVISQIAVSGLTEVTVTDSQSGKVMTTICRYGCEVIIEAVGFEAGTITAIAGDIVLTSDYPSKNP